MNISNCIRVVIVLAVVAWPTYETYRLHLARQEARESIALCQKVEAKLAAMKQNDVRYAVNKTKPQEP